MMSILFRNILILSVLLLNLFIISDRVAWASNGLNLIGFGSESYMMGGADLAVARDTSAMNTNPAGLSQIDHRELDFYLALGFPLDFRHQDSFGNDQRVSSDPAKLGNFGYAHHLADGRLTLGIGLFGQGGSGVEYDSLTTPFNTQDDLSIAFRVARLTPAAAYQVNDALSVGASMLITYADFKEKIFPETSFADPSDPTRSFFGIEMKGMDALNVGAKVGILYRLNENARIGIAYTSPVKLKFDGGKLTANMTAIGLGKVTYQEVSAEGLDQPQELGIGLALVPAAKLLVSIEANWIDWSHAVKRTTLNASNPDHPAAPSTLAVSQDQNWRDQYVIALGLAYEATERLLIRAGYNYGRNPIPAQALNPLLPTVGEHHVTFGGGYRIHPQWQIDGGIEYAFKNEVTYTNPNLPFGPNAKESYEFASLHLTLSRRW